MRLRLILLAAPALAASCACLSFGLGRWVTGNVAALAQERRRAGELESHFEAARRRYEAKRGLAAEIVAGRMTLREATGHFRRLNETDPGFPPGIPRPSADERVLWDRVLDSAWEIQAHQGRFAESARWYAEVFAAHPELLAEPPTGHRYHAARVAAWAGCGQGRDAADLDEKGRAEFRRKALDWLRADLAARRRLLDQEPERPHRTVADDLQYWLWDPSFVAVREADALSRLPVAERQAWQQLWADVADTLTRAEGPIHPG